MMGSRILVMMAEDRSYVLYLENTDYISPRSFALYVSVGPMPGIWKIPTEECRLQIQVIQYLGEGVLQLQKQ